MASSKFNLVKNIRFSVIGFIINIFLVFISYKLVILHSGLAAVGLWATIMAWINIIRIGDMGLSNASLRFVATIDAKEKLELNKIKKYIDTGTITNLVFFSILGFIAFSFLTNYLPNIIEEVNYLTLANEILPLVVIIFILMNVSSVLLGSLQGLHIGYIGVYVSIIANILQLLLILLLVPNLGLIGLAWAQLINYLTLIIITWFIISIKVKNRSLIPSSFSLRTLQEMLSFSITAQFASTANGMLEPISKILVNNYGGLYAQGIYELAYKTVSLSRNAVVSGLTATLPASTRLIEENNKKIFDLYRSSVKKVTIAIILVMLLASFLSPLISYILLEEVNWQFSLFVLILAIGFTFNTYGAPAYNLGLAFGILKYNIIISLASLSIVFILGSLLGMYFTANGVVISIAIGLLIGGYFIKKYNEKLLKRM